MNCVKNCQEIAKTKQDYNEALLKSIELTEVQHKITKCPKSDKPHKVTAKASASAPWQFFLDTHYTAADINWWKSNRYI